LLDVVAEAQSGLDSLLSALRDRHRRQLEAVRAGGARLEELRRQRSVNEHELAATRSRLQKAELDLVEAAVRRESVVETLRRELGCGPEEARGAAAPELPEGVDPAARGTQLEAELAAIGPVNPLAMEELSELGERHQFLESQVEDVRKAQRELRQVIRTLDEEIMHVFDSAFADVNEHFSTLITSLFPGGTGRLSLTDPENLLDTGVEVEVRPAGRNVRRLSLLSGGERSLVAMAYLFAVFRSRPSPFYLMDEVEAALDDVNLMRFLALVNEFRDEAQLIIVSHQKRTMEAADALYGVTMAPGGSSKVVSQKVPRDRTAVDTLEAPPTTKVDVAATAPVVVPELGIGVGPSEAGVEGGLASTDASAPPWPLTDEPIGTASDDGSAEVTEAAIDAVGEAGSDDASLAHLVDEPEHRQGPVIPVPPRRVDVGGSATGRGDFDPTPVTDR
jgi:chromosome segregation ATPase